MERDPRVLKNARRGYGALFLPGEKDCALVRLGTLTASDRLNPKNQAQKAAGVTQNWDLTCQVLMDKATKQK